MIIAVTESNNVYALNATTGLPIWSRTDIGPPVTRLPRAEVLIPLVSLARRLSISPPDRLFFDALINGYPIKHFIYSLNVDTGATNAGLAGGPERHRYLQRNSIHFSGAGTTRWHWLW